MKLKFNLDDKAVKEIKYLLQLKEVDPNAGIRVGVRGGGCSGYTYTLNFGVRAEGDIVMEQEGVKLFTDPKSVTYLNGTTLTYTDGLQGKGFNFENPNAAQTCGCGESFSV
tara:strand:+ start:343 stop:675 length:333 start_codon:yes stop_codon:yes gene_type:complete